MGGLSFVGRCGLEGGEADGERAARRDVISCSVSQEIKPKTRKGKSGVSFVP